MKLKIQMTKSQRLNKSFNLSNSTTKEKGTFLFLTSPNQQKNRNVPFSLSFVICALILFCHLCFGISALAEGAPSLQKEEKISLDLKNIEVVELLRILALKTGRTIVPSKDVTGRITVFLNNVTLKDVLDIIVLTQGYAIEKQGGIYYIMSAAEYKVRYGKDYIEQRRMKVIKLSYAKPANVFNALSQLKSDIGKIIADEASGTIILIDIPEKIEIMEKTALELDQPLQTTVFNLNYIKPADAKTQLNAAITPGTGQVIVDERNGKAIVSDLPRKMEKISRLVKEIDEETREVFLETEIAEVTLSNDFSRGINWEQLFSQSRLAGLDFLGNFPVATALATYQQISVGSVPANRFNVVIKLLESYGDTKIISQPRIAAVNNEEASIMVGTREAYVTQTLSQAQSTTVTSESIEFVDVGVKLKIIPTINKDGYISMKIKPEVSSVKETITTSLGSRIPIVSTSQAETVVKVKDGTMIMIAGLIQEQNTDTITGLPWLSRLPVIGSFFGNRDKSKQRTELIVFVTPHLIKGDTTLPGYEPEKIIPKDIMPETVKRKIAREWEMADTLEFPARKMQEELIRAESEKLEQERQAAEFKKIDDAIKLETAVKAENAKKEQEKKEQEAQKKAQQEGIKKQAEEERKQAEAKRQEKIRKAQELKKQEEAKKTEEANRQQEEIKKAQEAKKAAEAKKQEEIRKQEEQRKQEQEEAGKKIKEEKKALEVKIPDRFKAAELYQKGLELQKSGNLNEAKDYFQKATGADPTFAGAYNQLGIILETAGLADEAEKMYLKTLDLDPKCRAAYSNLALLNEAKGDKPKAIEYWKKRVQLGEPTDLWTKEALRHIEELNKNKI